jgi:hypothetical protein
MKISLILAAAVALAPAPAAASDPHEAEWTNTFEKMIVVYLRIKQEPGNAALKKEFALLRARLTAADIGTINARSAKAVQSGKERMERSVSEDPRFVDEAEFKSSLGGAPAPEIERRRGSTDDPEIDDEASFKERLGDWHLPDEPKVRRRRDRTEPPPRRTPGRVGKGASEDPEGWDHPDDWKGRL